MNLHSLKPPRTRADYCRLTWPGYEWREQPDGTLEYRFRGHIETPWWPLNTSDWHTRAKNNLTAYLAGGPYKAPHE